MNANKKSARQWLQSVFGNSLKPISEVLTAEQFGAFQQEATALMPSNGETTEVEETPADETDEAETEETTGTEETTETEVNASVEVTRLKTENASLQKKVKALEATQMSEADKNELAVLRDWRQSLKQGTETVGDDLAGKKGKGKASAEDEKNQERADRVTELKSQYGRFGMFDK